MKTRPASWDDLRFLLAVHRDRSFFAAGKSLGVAASTVARRVEAVERSLGRANAGNTHLESAPRLDLEVDERTLGGIVHLSPAQTRATLGLLSSLLCREPKQAAEAVKAKP